MLPQNRLVQISIDAFKYKAMQIPSHTNSKFVRLIKNEYLDLNYDFQQRCVLDFFNEELF